MPQAGSVPAATWPTLGGSLALIIGAFLPWATVSAPFIGTINKNGIDGDGVFTLIAGVAVAVLGFPLVSQRTLKPGRGIPIAIVSGLAAAISIYDLVDVQNAVNDVEGPVAASAGSGLYLTVAGAIAALVGGVMIRRSGP